MVPHLTNILSPPVSSGGTFVLPSRRRAPVYVPKSHYAYHSQRMRYMPSQRFYRVSALYKHFFFTHY